ncbi:MAG: pyridoxal phosphate-dependent aminotransferase family protein, partial [Allomuricauda sp.]
MAYPIDHIPDRQIYIDGKPHLYFGGTAYLGVQNHPEFIKIFTKNIKAHGLQYGASRRSNVFLPVYGKAEHVLANWVGGEAGLTLSSGDLAAQLGIQKL